MSNFKFELDRNGVKELLKSDGVAEACREKAETVLERCGRGEGYVMESRRYPERTGYAVYASDYPAIQDNLENNTLLKALS